MSVKVLVLRAPGSNCDVETIHAFETAGAVVETLHINRLLETPAALRDYQILCVQGGFSYGDDLASGRILGNQLKRNLGSVLGEFKEQGKLVLGICNGFQVLMNCGLFWSAAEDDEQPATLAWNESGRYLDRWVELVVDKTPCVFLQGIERLTLPVAHGEGRFLARSSETLANFHTAGQLALRYTDATVGELDAPIAWPANPNGAAANTAGFCDPSGRVFGLMPHPERYTERTHHPRWTRGEGTDPAKAWPSFKTRSAIFHKQIGLLQLKTPWIDHGVI